MNSKSQYNRCTLPRISFGNHIDTEEELETEEELMVKNEIKKMRKSKREKRMKKLAEEDQKKLDLRKVCIEVKNSINEEEIMKRREKELELKRKLEMAEDEKKKKLDRINEAKRKKERLLRKLRLHGKLRLEGKSREWVEKRSYPWRKYREKVSEDRTENMVMQAMFDDIVSRIPVREKRKEL